MSADNRSVHTDALATLGTIISDKEKRDAIHLAVEPAVAAARLHPGQDVGPVEGGYGPCENPLGIVDPFLKSLVQRGERFWLVVYPRQITSLRHVWEHPAFPSVVVPNAPTKSESEAWLRAFCKNNDCPSYESVIQGVNGTYGEEYKGRAEANYFFSSLDGESFHFNGTDAHGSIPDEFWTHVENVTGKKGLPRARYFSCSC